MNIPTPTFYSDKVAVITGGSRGLGKAMAMALARSNTRIALVARNRAKLEEALVEVRNAGAEAEAFVADVTDESAVQRLRDDVMTRFGAVHILINNAGVNIRKPLVDYTLTEWRTVLDTNLTSAFLVCHAFIPVMKGRGYGRIINMTSMMSHISLPGRVAYSSSKFGLLGFTKALALELAADKITVNGISPGPFATEMNIPVMQNPETNKDFLSRLPVGRWGNVEEIGKLAHYICCEEAGFLTGTDIVIDGGWTAQ